jgi:hypothetical protein
MNRFLWHERLRTRQWTAMAVFGGEPKRHNKEGQEAATYYNRAEVETSWLFISHCVTRSLHCNIPSIISSPEQVPTPEINRGRRRQKHSSGDGGQREGYIARIDRVCVSGKQILENSPIREIRTYRNDRVVRSRPVV